MASETHQARGWRRYPNYKPSGIGWLGSIPGHWGIRPLKYAAGINSEVLAESTDPAFALKYVDITNVDSTGRVLDVQEMAFEQAPSRARRRVRRGDSIMSTVRTYLKAISYMEDPPENLVVSTGFAVLRPGSLLEPEYLWRLVQTQGFVDTAVAHSEGIGYPAITSTQLAQLPVWVPPLLEQRAIAAFLDRETAKIDTLIAKQQRLIELLEEERTALISHAVTKGLDPTVPTKDSGVEWLGEIPAHWEVRRLKSCTSLIRTGSTPPTGEPKYYEDGHIPWFGPASFGAHLVLRKPSRLVTDAAVRDRVARLFSKGSSMIVTIGATLGKVGLLAEAASSNQQITAVVFSSDLVLPEFGAYQLKRLEPVLRAIAPSTTLPIMDQNEVGMLPLAAPSLSEQSAICAYLGHQTGTIDALMAKVEEAIERLQEYRTALISAAVTGKIDVRDTLAEEVDRA